MNALSTISLIVSIALAILGISGYRIDPSRRENRLFLYLSLCHAWVLFTAVFTYSAPSKDALVFWYKMGAPGLGLFEAINLHLYLAIDGRRLKPWQYALLYLPALFVMYAIVFDVCIFSDFIFREGSWIFVPAQGYFWFYFYTVYFLSYLTASLWIMFRRGRRGSTFKERRQSRVIFLSLLSLVVLGVPLDLIFTQHHPLNIPAIGPLVFAVIYIPGLWYAITHYRFLHFTPSLMANEIIAHIQEMVILLGPGLTIMSANERAALLLGVPGERLRGMAMSDILADPGCCVDELRALDGGEAWEGGRWTRITFRGASESVIADTYIAGMLDRFGDPAGVLVIARENRSARDFSKRFRITPRQFHVIDALIRGESARELAACNGISVRTVETHITNIYNRLGVSNRIELARLAREYGIE